MAGDIRIVLNVIAKDAKKVVGDLTGSMEQGFGNASKATQAFSTSLVAIIGLVIGLKRVVSETVTAFARFDDTMRQAAAVSSASGVQFEQMTNLAKQMGINTRHTAIQTGEAFVMLTKAGLGVKNSMAAIPNTLQLASAATVDLGTSADILTNIMTGYGFKADNLGKVTDYLVATFTSTNSTLEELGLAFSYAGPLAKAAGLKFSEVAAILGKLHDAGIKGSMAGTTLRGVIAALTKPTDATAQVFEDMGISISSAQQELRGLGVSIVDSSGNMKPLQEILADLKKGLDQLPNRAERVGKLMTIFGKRAGPGVAALIEMGTESIGQLQEKLESSTGIAGRIADQMEAGLGGSLRALKSAVEGLALSIGEYLAPTFKSLAESLTTITRVLASMDDSTKAFLASVLTISAALVSWKLVISKAVVALVSFSKALAAGEFAATGLTVAMTALVAVWAAFEVTKLVGKMQELSEAQEDLKKGAEKYLNEAKKYEQYADIQAKGLNEIKTMSREALAEYVKGLQGALQFQTKMKTHLMHRAEQRSWLGTYTEDAILAQLELQQLEKRTKELFGALSVVAPTAKKAGVTMTGELMDAANNVEGAVSKIAVSLAKAMKAGNVEPVKKSFDEVKSILKEAEEDYGILGRHVSKFYDDKASFAKDSAKTERDAILEPLKVYQEKAQKVLALAEEEYNHKNVWILGNISEEKKRAELVTQNEQTLTKARIAAIDEWKGHLESALSSALSAERKYTNEIQQLNTQIEDAEVALDDELRALRRSRMSDEERVADTLAQAREKEAAAAKALEEKQFELAKKLANQSKSLYAEVAQSSKDKFDTAAKGVESAGKTVIEAQKGQKKEAEQNLDAIRQTITDLKKNLEDIRITQMSFTEDGSLTTLKKQYDEIKDKIVKITFSSGESGSTAGGAEIPAYHTGGVVSGGPRLPGWAPNEVLARLRIGEVVLPDFRTSLRAVPDVGPSGEPTNQTYNYHFSGDSTRLTPRGRRLLRELTAELHSYQRRGGRL